MVLCPVIGKLLHKRVVLASASPRRQEILSNAGLRFEVVPSRFKEKLDKASFATPYGYAMETAKQKALEVATRMHQARGPLPFCPHENSFALTRGFAGAKSPGAPASPTFQSLQGDQLGHPLVSLLMTWSVPSLNFQRTKLAATGSRPLGGMLVESVHGGLSECCGLPAEPLLQAAGGELYYPPRPEDLRQPVQHDSIPAVDTFEDLSDVEGGGSEPAQRETGSRDEKAEVGAAGRATAEAECHRTRATLPPFPTRLLELLDGFKLSKALLTACKLKVFDRLKREAPQKAPDIASKVDASACGTEKLLDVCAAMGLLEKTEQGYSNTETANLYLASDSEYSLHGFMLQNNDVIWNLFTYLEFAIREGRNQHHRVLGKKVEDLFQEAYYRSPETQLRFMQAMHGVAKLTARQVATAFDLSRFSSACDVGGCTGALARELAREYPRLQVTVFDLPDVVELAVHFQPAGPQAAQIHFAAGDFFRDPLPSAELYVLCRILHNWSDDKVHKLLSKVAESCKPGTGLLLVETLLDEEKREAQGGLIQSLNTLVQTEGRERSRGEYQCLLELHGFHQVQVVHLEGVLDAMLATRVAP
ncbi:probable bifunctional dTTP/UTP pyrophosphatase/methyltransferase protein [Macaca nemestrina]|uniref:probable bifunctional dTTP/UTP pyrophosphatase/methyltransferase protein n=1 Tax=Macaca nemestrina TaxID=9545 RepID=UPI0039B85000